MSTSDKRDELSLLCADALEELLTTSDAELRKEALEDGINIEEVAANVKDLMRGTAASTLRKQLYTSTSSDHGQEATVVTADNSQPLEKIKEVVKHAFQQNPELQLAYRDGKKQSDNDWKSLYEDLVDLGVIDPEDYVD